MDAAEQVSEVAEQNPLVQQLKEGISQAATSVVPVAEVQGVDKAMHEREL